MGYTSAPGLAVPGLLTPGDPGSVNAAAAAALVAALSAFPGAAATATASLVLPPPGNCAWVRSSYY